MRSAQNSREMHGRSQSVLRTHPCFSLRVRSQARQWVWGVKNAPRKDPVVKAALEEVEKNFGAWMKRYPFKRGDSPLASVPDYENFIFDQAGDMSYASPYWKQIGLNVSERRGREGGILATATAAAVTQSWALTRLLVPFHCCVFASLQTEEYLDEFMDIPALWMSGWYDICTCGARTSTPERLCTITRVAELCCSSLLLSLCSLRSPDCRSTIDFFVELSKRKKGPHLLIMGPWQHVGPEGHVAGDVDFGVNALISGNLAPTVPSLARRWFDRFVTPATARAPRKLTPQEKLQMVISAAEEQQQQQQQRAAARASTSASGDFLSTPGTVRGPYTSLSRIPASLTASNSAENLARGPSMYLLPSSLPKEPRRGEDDGPLPPAVRYFRMGGGDGHKTSQGCMFHGGVWMAANSWPPAGTQEVCYYLGKRTLTPNIYDRVVFGAGAAAGANKEETSNSSNRSIPHATAEGEGETTAASDLAPKLAGLDLRGEVEGSSASSSAAPADGPASSSSAAPYRFRSHTPPAALRSSSAHVTTFDYDPRHPVPSIGGNVFGYKDVLLAGAFNQVERAGHFLCEPPFLPLSSRADVVVFRTPVLSAPLDVTGMIVVHLIVSSSAVDTDFTAKILDEYPASPDYPAGYAMQITHGIRRARFRDSRSEPSLMNPGQAYELSIELYPTSNLFAAGHRLRLDISSSNFPHFDTNRNTGEDFESARTVIAQNSVWHHEAYPSRVVLPIQTKSQQHNGIRMTEAGR